MKEEMNEAAQKESEMLPPRKRRKKKKELVTPTQIIRYSMIAVYVMLVFFLSSPFISASLYIKEDLTVSFFADEAYSKYSTQDEIDKAEKDLSDAIAALEKNPDADVAQYQTSLSLPTAQFEWIYHIAKDIDAKNLIKKIDEAKDIDRRFYTEETVENLNTATLSAQKCLCATVKISQSALQLMVGGSISESFGGNTSASIGRYILIYGLAFLPVVGVFFATFDRRRHLKNIYGAVCSVLALLDIIVLIYPMVAIGSVLSIFLYLLLFFLSALGFYAKQQEDYIIKHPEKEAEFSEKHPQFVKALINHKSATVPNQRQRDRDYTSAQNAKKHGRSRKN